MEKCLVGILDTPKSSKTHTTLSVVGGGPAHTTAPSESAGELSLIVPTLTTPSTDEDTLSLQMLRQANIKSHDSVEEDIQIHVPSWIQPAPRPVTTINEIGTSVDPPWVGYETAV